MPHPQQPPPPPQQHPQHSQQQQPQQLRSQHVQQHAHVQNGQPQQQQQQVQQQQQQQQQQQVTEVVLATAGYDHTIRFWEALSGICVRTIQHPDSQVNRLVVSPDKRYLAAAGNPHLRLYDVQSNNPNPIMSYDGHTGNITSVAFQSAGRWIVTGSEDGTIKIWDTRTPGIQRDYELKCAVNDVIIHPNQGELISADQNGSIKIWDLGENSCTHELLPEEDTPARSVTMSADGTLLIAGNNKGNFYVWKTRVQGDMTELDPVMKMQAHNKYLTKCLLSPDAKFLATCSADHTVKIWGHSLEYPQRQSPSSSSSPASPTIPQPQSTFKHVRTLVGHQRWVWDCAFSADSAYLVSASSDNTARLWDLSSGETIRQYNGHQKSVVTVALHDLTN